MKGTNRTPSGLCNQANRRMLHRGPPSCLCWSATYIRSRSQTTYILPLSLLGSAKPPHHHTTFPYFPSHESPKPRNAGGGTRQDGMPSLLSPPADPLDLHVGPRGPSLLHQHPFASNAKHRRYTCTFYIALHRRNPTSAQTARRELRLSSSQPWLDTNP